MVNYDISQPDQRRMWFNAKVKVLSPLVCTVMAGVELTPVPDCTTVLQEECMRIEKPVRGQPSSVGRSDKGSKHIKYTPELGNRYDGIYDVVKYWPEMGKRGFREWRYLIRRDDPAPAPWTKEGKKIMGEVDYPEGYHEAQAKKDSKEAEKQWLKAENKAVGKVKHKTGKENVDKDDERKKGKGGRKRKVEDTTDVSVPQVKKAKIFEDILQSMEADELDKKLWDEVTEKKYTNKKEMTEFVESQLCCIICQDVVFQPVIIPCFHKQCLDWSWIPPAELTWTKIMRNPSTRISKRP